MSDIIFRLGKRPTLKSWFLQPKTLIATPRVRAWPFVVLIVAAMGVLAVRLLFLTLVEGGYRRQMADSNRVLGVRTAAQRGVFLDRNGQRLVVNVPAYKRQVLDTTLHESKFEPIGRDEALALQYQDGERVFYDVRREYPCGRACGTLVGYMSEVTPEVLETQPYKYMLGDWMGVAGLERMYESELSGRAGSQLLEVNAAGEEQRVIGQVDAREGLDITLTIDLPLQQLLYEAMEGQEGAAVASNPQTGEILAMVSSPSYDPSDIASSLNSPDQPFFNRAIGGSYPPGSVFKIVTAVAGLEEGKLTSETVFEDTGVITIDTYRYGNWYFDQYGKTEGAVDVVKALQRSNDIFFYKAGETVGAEALAEWAHIFGYGKVSGLEGLGEVPGLIPDPAWKSRTKGERWFLGNTYHMAIGQGDVLVTPLQVNRMMGVMANGGTLCPPILKQDEVGQQACQQLNLDSKTIALVREGLEKACQPGGTGVAFFKFGTPVACKTGTAQEGGATTNPHAWFTVYAPANNPNIVLTVLIAHGGQGSEVASPIALKGIEYWLKKN